MNFHLFISIFSNITSWNRKLNTNYSQIRDAAGRVEELEASNRHLEIRLAKAKAAIPTC